MSYKIAIGPAWIAENIDFKNGKITRSHFPTMEEAEAFSKTSWNVVKGEAEGYNTEQTFSPQDYITNQGRWLADHKLCGND